MTRLLTTRLISLFTIAVLCVMVGCAMTSQQVKENEMDAVNASMGWHASILEIHSSFARGVIPGTNDPLQIPNDKLMEVSTSLMDQAAQSWGSKLSPDQMAFFTRYVNTQTPTLSRSLQTIIINRTKLSNEKKARGALDNLQRLSSNLISHSQVTVDKEKGITIRIPDQYLEDVKPLWETLQQIGLYTDDAMSHTQRWMTDFALNMLGKDNVRRKSGVFEALVGRKPLVVVLPGGLQDPKTGETMSDVVRINFGARTMDSRTGRTMHDEVRTDWISRYKNEEKRTADNTRDIHAQQERMAETSMNAIASLISKDKIGAAITAANQVLSSGKLGGSIIKYRNFIEQVFSPDITDRIATYDHTRHGMLANQIMAYRNSRDGSPIYLEAGALDLPYAGETHGELLSNITSDYTAGIITPTEHSKLITQLREAGEYHDDPYHTTLDAAYSILGAQRIKGKKGRRGSGAGGILSDLDPMIESHIAGIFAMKILDLSPDNQTPDNVWKALHESLILEQAFSPGIADRIEVIATDFQFTPNAWSMKSGETTSILLRNHGKEEHEWVLLKLGTKVTLPFDTDDEAKVFWEIEAGPTIEKSETFIAPLKSGIYDIICGKPGHIEQGMRGTLIVK